MKNVSYIFSSTLLNIANELFKLTTEKKKYQIFNKTLCSFFFLVLIKLSDWPEIQEKINYGNENVLRWSVPFIKLFFTVIFFLQFIRSILYLNFKHVPIFGK